MSTLSVGFDSFRRGLEAPEAPADAILDRQRLRAHIASAWQPVKDVVVGSYKRGTSLRPTREVDYLFVLSSRNQSYLNGDPVKALDDIGSRLGVAYPQARPRRAAARARRVVSRHDGGCSSRRLRGTAAGSSSPIRSSNVGSRRIPTPTRRALAEHRRKQGEFGALVVRALKCWKRTRAVPVRGFHLESLALRAITAAPESLAHACFTAFDGIAASAKVRCPAVGPVGDDVDMYLALDPARRAKIAQAALDAADALRDAAAHYAERNPVAACAAARAVFGVSFPGE